MVAFHYLATVLGEVDILSMTVAAGDWFRPVEKLFEVANDPLFRPRPRRITHPLQVTRAICTAMGRLPLQLLSFALA